MSRLVTMKAHGRVPGPRPARPDFRRPFSDGSMTVPTSDLAATLVQNPYIPPYYQPFPQLQHPQSFHFSPNPEPISIPHEHGHTSNVGKAPKARTGRKGSMTDVKPVIRQRTQSASRAMSFNEGRSGLGLGLQTHMEDRTTSDWNIPNRFLWDSSGSVPSMQSFGTTVDSAILDSPTSPSFPPLPAEADEESKKQRRRECHNQVEKRRREHINTKIEELSLLLPASYHQTEDIAVLEEEEEDENDSPKKKKNRRNSVLKQKEAAHCKGRVLTQSVQYIQ